MARKKDIRSWDSLLPIVEKHGLGIPPLLVRALITEESGFDANALSGAGAVGLMQIMQQFHPGKDLANPAVNIHIGCSVLVSDFYYLNHIRAGLDPSYPSSLYPWSDMSLLDRALAGYNMGPGNVVWYDSNHPDNPPANWPVNVRRYCANIWSLWQRYKGESA